MFQKNGEGGKEEEKGGGKRKKCESRAKMTKYLFAVPSTAGHLLHTS